MIAEKKRTLALAGGQAEGSRALAGRVAALVIGVTLVLAAAKVIRGGDFLAPEWDIFLGRTVVPTLARLAPALICLVIYALGTRLLAAAPGWLFVLWTLLGGVAFPVSLTVLTGDPFGQLVACVLSKTCSGGYWAGVILSPATLHDWPAIMPGLLEPIPHFAVRAPGWPLLFAGAFNLFDHFPALSALLAQPLRDLQCNRPDLFALGNARLAGAWLGIATPLWGALTVVPVYYLGKRLAGRSVARTAAAWWPLVPSLALFLGSISIPDPFLSASVVALFCAGVLSESRRRSAALLILAGVAAGAALVLSLALLPLLALCGLFAAALLLYPPVRARAWPRFGQALGRLIVAGLWFIVGIAGVYAAYRAAAGHSLADVLAASMGVHLLAPHSYLKGLGLDAWDYAMYAGLPVAGLAVVYPAARKPAPLSALAFATGLTLLVLDVSGIARNEVGRVWMFFTPFVLLIAAAALTQLDGRLRALAAAAQIVWLLAMATTWWPWHVELLPQATYQQAAQPALSTPVTPSGAVVDGRLKLQGFQSQYAPETRTLTVALHWQVLGAIEAPQRFGGVLVGPGGQALPGLLWDPLAGRYPTTCWQQGQPAAGGQIVDQVAFPLGDAAAAGDWWLSLRAYPAAGDQAPQPLSVALPDGTQDTQVGLGPLPVAGK